MNAAQEKRPVRRSSLSAVGEWGHVFFWAVVIWQVFTWMGEGWEQLEEIDEQVAISYGLCLYNERKGDPCDESYLAHLEDRTLFTISSRDLKARARWHMNDYCGVFKDCIH